MIRIGHRLRVARYRMFGQLMERHRYVLQTEAQSNRDSVVPVDGCKRLVEPEIERHEDAALTDVRREAVEMCGGVYQC